MRSGATGMMIDADIRVEGGDWPPGDTLDALVNACLGAVADEIGALPERAEVAILFTDDAAQKRLNHAYRGKDAATNVLSFPVAGMTFPPGVPRALGDISLACETVKREARASDTAVDDHLRHLIIHGLLHLLGYDHEDDAEATVMERTETRALARLGIADPYRPNQVQDA